MIAAVPLLIAAAFLGLAAGQLVENRGDLEAGVDTAALPSTLEGRAAPDLAVTQLGDLPLLERAMLDDDGLVALNFFASWCPPCRTEHPTLTALAEAGLPLYGVNFRDPPVNGLAFLQELGNPYRAIGADRQARLGPDWGVIAMPETYFIAGGEVILHVRGPVVPRTLESRIRPALAEAGYTLPRLDGGDGA